MGLVMRAARVQGCAMQAYRARDVRMWGWGSRLQAEETGMWEYRAGNTGIQRYKAGNVGCKRAGCRGTELRMLGYGAGGVGIGRFCSDNRRQWDAEIQSWRR